MLRDLITSAAGVATWPCDEINYIWRHGNMRFPSDAFTTDMAEPWIQAYIRRKFQWVAQRYDAHTVVEKTCANSLRVPFVDQILERPKYIFIYRSGLDVVGSAMRRWRASLDLPYVLRKARFVPPSDLPYYALRYLGSRIGRLKSSDRQLTTWGPVLPDVLNAERPNDLAELCAHQWQVCVERSLDAFDSISEDRVLRIAYERLVEDKATHASRIEEFLDIDVNSLAGSAYLGEISAHSVGKASAKMSSEAITKINQIIEPTMQRLGY